MRRAIYAGTFDPPTNGHLDIIQRGSKLFDEVVVVIMQGYQEQGVFSIAERTKMMRMITADLANVSVDSGQGLAVHYAKQHEARVLIRGIRAVMDYEHEMQQATTNMTLDPTIETVFLLSRPRYSFMTSSGVNEIAVNHGSLEQFVPDAIRSLIEDHFA